MAAPLLGHLDRTENPFTIAASGPGSAGMEAALVDLIEPGDAVVVVTAGAFGNRMAEIVGRAGGRLIREEGPGGGLGP